MKEHDVIDSLVDDLKPRKRSLSPNAAFLIWAICNFVFVFLSIGYTGKLRPGWQSDILTNWQFILEFTLGMGVSTIAGYFLFLHAIPSDLQNRSSLKWLPFVILLVFTATLSWSIYSPAIGPEGKIYRAGCLNQLIGFSIPPLFILLFYLKRSAPVNLYYVGFLAGLAAAAPFATAMHIACAYDPTHVLIFHIFPVIALALVTAAAANLFIRWWK